MPFRIRQRALHIRFIGLGWSEVAYLRSSVRSRLCQLLCPPNRQMGTFAHRQPHAIISTKSFCFSANVENRKVVFGGPPALGAGGLEFKSPRPDHLLLCFQFALSEATSPEVCTWVQLGPNTSISTRSTARRCSSGIACK
jgi:hypothetical protein